MANVSKLIRPRGEPGHEQSWERLIRASLQIAEGGAKVAAAIITALVLEKAYGRWGATPGEVDSAMPGDELVPEPKITSTRALTINASPEAVWAWLVQIGQGRGGFYSYDALENLVRCDIHSADEVVPDLQVLHPGDLILLAPGAAPCFRVVQAEPARSLTLAGADPKTRTTPTVTAARAQVASTWQWSLQPVNGGRTTRLVARQRYSCSRRQAVSWHVVAAVSFVMERRMLHGIRVRAERRGSV